MSGQRSVSPTTAVCQQRREAREQMATMLHMGLHVFNPEWQVNKSFGRMFSPTFRQITLKIFGKSDTLTFPVQTCTRVSDVRAALSKCLMLEQDRIEFFVKQGCNTRKQRGSEEIASSVTVKGITSFTAHPHRWPHPIGLIGCGYGGQKALMTYAKDGNADSVVAFERLPGIGGFNWLKAANKTSRIQTELGSFHIWWGQEFVQDGNGYPDADRWGIWPDRALVIQHMQFAAEEYGILPHVHFNSEVVAAEIVGKRTDPGRYYNISVRSTDGSAEGGRRVAVSAVWGFPGIMARKRVVEYPGEDVFEGVIAYGMGDECPYEKAQGQNAAVLGCGAFAVENARTVVEHGATKVWIVARRKNLVCPRLPSWFAHQGPVPTPGWLIIKMLEPMYELAKLGDPWQCYSVKANRDRTTATIIQGARFGIGDVTFLMCYYGKLEIWQDTVKRLAEKIVHLDSGRKLEDVGVIVKALGMVGDFQFDRIMNMTEAVGNFCDGDWRRPFHVDALGLSAGNFSTFSAGLQFKEFAKIQKYLFDFPRVFHAAEAQGFMEALPVHAAQPDEDRPAYAIGLAHAMTSFMLLNSHCPELVTINLTDEAYKHRMYHSSHGTQYFVDACTAEWNRYQNEWRRQGATQDFLPYPYTKDMIDGYFLLYNRATKSALKASGPPEDSLPIQVPDMIEPPGKTPDWVKNDASLKGVEMQVNDEHKSWWVNSGFATFYDGFARKEMRNPILPDMKIAVPGWWQAPEERAAAAALEQQIAEGERAEEAEEEEQEVEEEDGEEGEDQEQEAVAA